MNHASLFSGIGGFDLAAEWMGWTNIFNCEIEPFPQKILKYHFPEAINYGDIKQTDFSVHRGTIDILTGGFPCQPYSMAGKRLGKNDERHLFPDMLRAIDEIKPTWVVGENVRGLVSWNDGVVFEETQADLEAQGYEVQSFILPAAGINAPHKRDRVWIVAYSESNRQSSSNPTSDRWEWKGEGFKTEEGRESKSKPDRLIQGRPKRLRSKQFAADTTHDRRGGGYSQEREGQREWLLQGERQGGAMGSEAQRRSREQPNPNAHSEVPQRRDNQGETTGATHTQVGAESPDGARSWQDFPTQPPVCGGDDGIPRELDAITFPKWRKESIKGYGNAIVPQIAYRIFKSIEAYESNQDTA